MDLSRGLGDVYKRQALLAVCADASVISSYAARRLGETKHQLEKVYGKGLVRMTN
jgi:hypothetical protein